MKLVSALSKIPPICDEFKKYPTNENGEEIIEIIENSERFLLQVKENVVRIVNEVKEENEIKILKEEDNNVDDEEIKGFLSDNGFLINKG